MVTAFTRIVVVLSFLRSALGTQQVICPLQSGPKVNLDWTLKETKNGQEARA
jgi:hypothetical protein